ncbi:hypothetical protein N7445_010891 [Penicillium cf. griseofulvum]|nr:hypothetical protein N7445_010891 [Penicillium cf. griseofulvum]
MAEYQSTWWRYRQHQIRELIASERVEPDTPAEADVELYNEMEEEILHERNQYEGIDSSEPTPLTDATHEPISAAEIDFVPVLPEYPSTHANGYAYIVNLKHLSKEEKRDALEHVQYSMKRDTSEDTIYCSFLQCYVQKRASHCTGVKYCANIDDYLRNLHHTKVNDELVARMFAIKRDNRQSYEYGQRQRQAVGFYDALRKAFVERKACTKANATCKLVYGKFKHPSISGDTMSFARCCNSSRDYTGDHYFTNLYMKRFTLDMGLLVALLEKGQYEDVPEACTVIYQTRSRAKTCDVVHPNGRGKMITCFPKCAVKFRTFIPLDLEKYPYAIFYSRGVHNHAPPPPSRRQILLSGFLRGNGAQELAQKYGAKTLGELHQSFANRERFSVILAKRRAIDYPMGRQLAGIRYQMEYDPELRHYIREIVEDERGVFIFCGLDAQLEILAGLHSFEVDMSYKRVKGIFNEVIFATFLPDHGKIITLFRVFTDQETTTGYHFIFGTVFNLVQRCIGKEIKFHYLHGSGADFRVLASLIKEHHPDLKGWVKHKEIDVIAAGLCKACSPIKPEFFEEARKHTNAVEQSHYKSYFMGTQDTLLGAVTKSQILDKTDINQYHNRDLFNIKHSYHADDIQTRFNASLRRESKIRKKRSYTQLDDIAPEDKELHEYSSSGHHSIARAKSKRGRGASRSQAHSTNRVGTRAISSLRNTTLVDTNEGQGENTQSIEDERKRVQKLKEELEDAERKLALRERVNV